MLKMIEVNGHLYSREDVESMAPIVEFCGVPPAILHAAFNSRDFDGSLHITDLISSGPRQKYLEITQDYHISIKSAIAAMYGTAMHKIPEAFKHDQHLGELSVTYKGIKMTMDSLYMFSSPDGDRLHLTDYKILGSYAVAKFLGITKGNERPVLDEFGNPKLYKSGKNAGMPVTTSDWVLKPNPRDREQYTMQLNGYALAVNEILNSDKIAEYPQLKIFAGMEVTDLHLFIIPRDGNLREAAGRGVTEPYYYETIEKMIPGYVDSYLMDRKRVLERHLETRTMPRICTEQEAWGGNKCARYCPVAEHCIRHGDNPYVGKGDDDE